MNHHLAHYIGAFVRWFINGFESSYMDEVKGNKGFKTQIEQNKYNSVTTIMGYISAFIIVTIIGILL